MNFDPTPDDIAIAESAWRPRKLRPQAQTVDETSSFVAGSIPALAELGVMGLNLPERWGGPGVTAVALYLSVEHLVAACGSTASMVTAHYLATDAVLIGGSDEQRARLLPDAAQGRKLGAFALTEPRAGSNPLDMSARAVREGAGWRLTGRWCLAARRPSGERHAGRLLMC